MGLSAPSDRCRSPIAYNAICVPPYIPRPAAHNRFDRRMPESDLEAETMSDHTKDCCENNVACDVSNCAYNADGKRCHADHI
ncbi:MAG: DUF1540 domain-containing protein, partial [Oscillospiraceae bacterium]